MKVRACYDFDAQPDSSEISIREGEILTVVRKDIGDGWWEGVNNIGKRGLFPESYVEIINSSDDDGPPTAPPPPLPEQFRQSLSFGSCSRGGEAPAHRQSLQRQDSWGDSATATSSGINLAAVGCQSASDTGVVLGSVGDFDDDWSEDDDSQVETDYSNHHRRGINTAISSGIEGLQHKDGRPQTGAVKKSMNRFSQFVKSGTENYLLNASKLSSKPNETIEIVWTSEGPRWAPCEPYTCSIKSHQKASKMHGLKSFIAYQLTPSLNNLQVSRRYKHFDWLFARLQEKYTVILVPPLPEKQVTGRYEDEFVEHRMQLLQIWLNKICRHPVLSHSDVWMHFLTCTDDKEWKKGKRKAEKDEYSGGSLFYTIKISPPNQILDLTDADQKIDNFYRTTRLFDDSVRNMQIVASENAKRMAGPFKREFFKLAGAFRLLASSFDQQYQDHLSSSSYLSSAAEERRLAEALQKTGAVYETVGKLYEDQPKKDCASLLNELFVYKGLLQSVPDVLQVHKSAYSKFRESQRLCEEGRISGQELDSIKGRVDVIGSSVLAEVNNFQKERLFDMNHMAKQYLNEQIDFYQSIVDKLKEAVAKFD